MSKPFVFINGEFLTEEKACLSIRDLSVQRGYGIFDFFRVAEGVPLFLNDHLDRFYYSAEQMRLPAPFPRVELTNIINDFVRKNDLAHCGIRLTLTGGTSADGYSISTPNLIITSHILQTPSEDQFRQGITLITYPYQRQLPHIKTIDYIMAIWLQPYIKEKGADDVLYHQSGSVTECPRANFFIVTKAQQLVTPEHNILKGITRNRVLQTAAQKLSVIKREITLEDIANAGEAFVTNTTKGVVPVTKVDDCIINKGKPGMVTTWLQQQLYAAAPAH